MQNLTAKQFRDSTLKQSRLYDTLMGESMYRQNKLQTDQMGQTLPENLMKGLYKKITSISARISSQNYVEANAQGATFRNQTLKEVEEIVKDLGEFIQNGSLTPPTYNNLLGYLTSSIGSSIDANKQSENAHIIRDLNNVSMIIKGLVAKNYTNLGSLTITDFLKSIDITTKEIKNILSGVQVSALTTGSAMTTGTGPDPNAPNISAPLSTRTSGAVSTTYNAPFNAQETRMVSANTGNAENWRSNAQMTGENMIETQNSINQTFGFPDDVVRIVFNEANQYILDGIQNGLTKNHIFIKLSSGLDRLITQYPNADVDKMLRMLDKRYDQVVADRAIEWASLNSKSSGQAQGDEYGKQLAIQDRAEFEALSRTSKKGPNQAQDKADQEQKVKELGDSGTQTDRPRPKIYDFKPAIDFSPAHYLNLKEKYTDKVTRNRFLLDYDDIGLGKKSEFNIWAKSFFPENYKPKFFTSEKMTDKRTVDWVAEMNSLYENNTAEKKKIDTSLYNMFSKVFNNKFSKNIEDDITAQYAVKFVLEPIKQRVTWEMFNKLVNGITLHGHTVTNQDYIKSLNIFSKIGIVILRQELFQMFDPLLGKLNANAVNIQNVINLSEKKYAIANLEDVFANLSETEMTRLSGQDTRERRTGERRTGFMGEEMEGQGRRKPNGMLNRRFQEMEYIAPAQNQPTSQNPDPLFRIMIGSV